MVMLACVDSNDADQPEFSRLPVRDGKWLELMVYVYEFDPEREFDSISGSVGATCAAYLDYIHAPIVFLDQRGRASPPDL